VSRKRSSLSEDEDLVQTAPINVECLNASALSNPASGEWWRNCTGITSTVRIRKGGSYQAGSDSAQKFPILDMGNVVIKGESVLVYGADKLSVEAVRAVKGKLHGSSLRANGLPDLKIVLMKGPMPQGSCDPSLAGSNALFFVKPWFWFNVGCFLPSVVVCFFLPLVDVECVNINLFWSF
jgi:hypothetical protein